MNKNCKYCDYISKCSRRCEYGSILCRLNRSFPKIIDKSYEDLQQENQQLKMIIEEYKRLNKENVRGFKITSVKQYNIDELVRCKNNWNELKEYLHNQIPTDKTVLTKHIKIFEVLDKMQEIEQGSDSNE